MDERLEWVWQAIRPKRLQNTLEEMIDIYSPFGKEEDIQLYLEALLNDKGLTVRRQEVEKERYNLIVTMGREQPDFFLTGHVDTIPAWDLNSYGPRKTGDTIFGLGSADMKGGCAAMVETFLAMADALPRSRQPSVGLLLVVGEEETGDGSAVFLSEYHPSRVVIGEPTSLAACLSHYGYLEGNFITRGRRIHSSLPELGHNAVESMLRVLLHLGRAPLFDRGRSEVVSSIREMVSSRAGFVVPDRCEAWIDLHLPPGISPALVEQKIRELGTSASGMIADLTLEMNFGFAALGYKLTGEAILPNNLAHLYETLGLTLRYDTFRSHSDGNLFFEAGVQPLLLGPGDLEVAHTPDEQISFPEVVNAAKIYAALSLFQDPTENNRS
ncbi:MAG: M20/M25/M40 family metallo-hydrolase [Proteobacteria bacterium]|nr:M20/M25/M40 family metallo-hydrolase [Pseudomonadota bacterium]MBU1686621.1 M20/M25/M40 family metallo-hydrolase [Pseudomonadota bacterium]